jgi:septal ring factor EnvC (AmiA/AmiB activator)
MGLQSLANNFDAKTPGAKAGVVAIFILIVLVFVALLLFLGSRLGRSWADSEYLQQRDENLKKIAVLQASADQHAQNEQTLAKENERLKAQNEATAEILKQNDAKIAGDAKKFEDLQNQREQKQNEIQNANDTDTRAGLCADAKSAGFNLSFCK